MWWAAIVAAFQQLEMMFVNTLTAASFIPCITTGFSGGESGSANSQERQFKLKLNPPSRRAAGPRCWVSTRPGGCASRGLSVHL